MQQTLTITALIPYGGQVIVVLEIGNIGTQKEVKCKALGVQGYVMKPIVRREFAGTIREVLDRAVAS